MTPGVQGAGAPVIPPRVAVCRVQQEPPTRGQGASIKPKIFQNEPPLFDMCPGPMGRGYFNPSCTSPQAGRPAETASRQGQGVKFGPRWEPPGATGAPFRAGPTGAPSRVGAAPLWGAPSGRIPRGAPRKAAAYRQRLPRPAGTPGIVAPRGGEQQRSQKRREEPKTGARRAALRGSA